MTSTSDNDKNKDAASDAKASGTRTKTDAYYGMNEKIADIFVDDLSNLFKKEQLEKIIQAEHFEKIKNLSQLHKILAITAVVVLSFISLELMLWITWLSTAAYVLWTEKPWEEKSSKTFMIFKNPTGELIAVKQGWSWPAFLFSWIWAMVKQMWVRGVFVGLLCLIVYAGFSGDIYGNFADAIFTFISIVFGINGNLWCEKKLLRSGFEKTTTVTAKNIEEALVNYQNNIGNDVRNSSALFANSSIESNAPKKINDDKQTQNRNLMKCVACGNDMGVLAEKCMNCGTANPKLVTKRKNQNNQIKVILIVAAVIGAIYFVKVYNSPYNKCMREGASSGLLNEKYYTSLCELTRIK